MKGIDLKNLQWEVHIQYENLPDSKVRFSAIEAPTFLAALAKVHSNIIKAWPYEIISLCQKTLEKQ